MLLLNLGQSMVSKITSVTTVVCAIRGKTLKAPAVDVAFPKASSLSHPQYYGQKIPS